MRLIELLPERVREHAKAVAAMVVPAVSLWLMLRLHGNVTWVEWVSIVGIALAAGGFVDMIPNRLTVDQVNRFYDQQEDQYNRTIALIDAETDAELRYGGLTSRPKNEPPDDHGKHRLE